MCMYECVCMCVCMYVDFRILPSPCVIFIHACIRTYTHTRRLQLEHRKVTSQLKEKTADFNYHTYINTYTHTHGHTYIYIHVHMHTYIHACMHTHRLQLEHRKVTSQLKEKTADFNYHTYINTYTHTHVHTYIYIHVHMHTYMHACIHTGCS